MNAEQKILEQLKFEVLQLWMKGKIDNFDFIHLSNYLTLLDHAKK